MKGQFEKRIKNILVKRQVIPKETVQEFEKLAKENGGSTIELLMKEGKLKEDVLLSTIAIEMNLAPINVDKVDSDEFALGTLSQDNAVYYNVLPIARIGNILTLAVSNPFDILKLDNIRLITNCEVRPVVGSKKKIAEAITRAYNPGDDEIKDILEGMVDPELELHQKEDDDDDQVDLSQLAGDGGDSPVIKLVNMIIFQALKEKVSDIHIEPFEKKTIVRYRQDGILHEAVTPPKKMHSAMVSRIKIMAQLDIAERRVPQDGKFRMRFEARNVDFRVSILPTVHGEKIVMRVLDSAALATNLDTLGFEPEVLQGIRNAVNAPYGMMLVTGPTGSGKSTTLYSCLRETLSPDDNISTVEDPVEYQMDGVIQVPVNAKQGMTFAAALRSLLRQDPDTIMIGEIRDFETANIAVKAALTGHLVLSTLHTNDAPSAVTRLVDMGVDNFMVASSVIIILAQRLGRRLCENCREEVKDVPKESLLEVGFLEEDLKKDFKIYKPKGCSLCVNGYKGRFAIVEALEINDDIKKLIIKGASAVDIKEYAENELKMINLRRCAILNVIKGKTSIEEVLRVTMK